VITQLMRFAAMAGLSLAGFTCAQDLLRRDEAASGAPRARAVRLMNELMAGNTPIGMPFTLTDQHGKKTRLADFRGKLVLLYFGYTTCPDVCPTDLATMAQAIESLGPQGAQVQPVFITLDPARDTRELLRNYARAFHPRIAALSGSEAEIRRIATAYKVYFEKSTPANSKVYLIEHTAFTFLLDHEGKYRMFFPPGTPPQRMVTQLREHLHTAAAPAGAP
jgi:protein SCO1/2